MEEEKTYQFTRLATYVQYGVVTAENEEDARNKIISNDYDDIFDTCLESEDNNTIQIEES